MTFPRMMERVIGKKLLALTRQAIVVYPQVRTSLDATAADDRDTAGNRRGSHLRYPPIGWNTGPINI